MLIIHPFRLLPLALLIHCANMELGCCPSFSSGFQKPQAPILISRLLIFKILNINLVALPTSTGKIVEAF